MKFKTFKNFMFQRKYILDYIVDTMSQHCRSIQAVGNFVPPSACNNSEKTKLALAVILVFTQNFWYSVAQLTFQKQGLRWSIYYGQ
jgi:hypothetical protein